LTNSRIKYCPKPYIHSIMIKRVIPELDTRNSSIKSAMLLTIASTTRATATRVTVIRILYLLLTDNGKRNADTKEQIFFSSRLLSKLMDISFL
jgi:hypothetical protein